MKLGIEEGLGPGHIVSDGDPAPPKGAQPPIFVPCLLWPNGRPSQLLLSSCFLIIIWFKDQFALYTGACTVTGSTTSSRVYVLQTVGARW